MKWIFGLAVISLCPAAAPVVLKIEPPDWVSPVRATVLRVMLTGKNLAGARVTPCTRSLKIGSAAGSANGDYLFVDLSIPAGERPGSCPLAVSTPEGTASAPFAVVAPLPPQGRFQGLSSDDVIYLIMPDRFANGNRENDDPSISRGLFDRSKPRYYHGGDLAGVRRKLPYLKNLGVTAIWLTPIYDNANQSNGGTDYHGYGATDLYAVEEHFGTLDSYRALVDEAHSVGIKVIQDQVANHTGPQHPWAGNSPTPHWFHGSESRHIDNNWATWTLLDPHAAPSLRAGPLDGWFANRLPDLNQDDPEVSRYLIQNALWWISRTGIDGIREDTVPYVPRTFWRDWSAAIHRDYPRFRVVGEVFEQDPALVSFFQRGHTGLDGVDTGIDTLFDFPLYQAIRHVFRDHAPLAEIARVVAHDGLYADASQLVTFLGLHDVPRFADDEAAGGEDLARAFSLLFAIRGIPMIYYGDEIGMRGGKDPDNRRDFPGGWPEDPRNAFEAAGRTPRENGLFDHVRRLSEVRASHSALRRGSQMDLLATEHAYAFARLDGSDRVIAVFHEDAAADLVRIEVSAAGLPDRANLVDALGVLPPATVTDGSMAVQMPARGAAIFVLRAPASASVPRAATDRTKR